VGDSLQRPGSNSFSTGKRQMLQEFICWQILKLVYHLPINRPILRIDIRLKVIIKKYKL